MGDTVKEKGCYVCLLLGRSDYFNHIQFIQCGCRGAGVMMFAEHRRACFFYDEKFDVFSHDDQYSVGFP